MVAVVTGSDTPQEWQTPARYVVSRCENATDDVVRNAAHRPHHAAFARPARRR
jgi:hypothetical protein